MVSRFDIFRLFPMEVLKIKRVLAFTARYCRGGGQDSPGFSRIRQEIRNVTRIMLCGILPASAADCSGAQQIGMVTGWTQF
jgi:hypothetical protein